MTRAPNIQKLGARLASRYKNFITTPGEVSITISDEN